MTYFLAAIFVSFFGIQEILELTLNDALKIALKNNKDILVQEKNVASSLAEILKRRGVFDPLLELSISFTDAESPTASTFISSGSVNEKVLDFSGGISGKLPTGTFYDLAKLQLTRTDTDSPIEVLSPNTISSLQFTVGQEILRDFGFQPNLAQVNIAVRSQQISQKELRITISNTLFGVQSAYWKLVEAKKFLELSQIGLELSLDLLRRNEIQVEVGVLPQVSVTQAKSEVALRRVDQISAENNIKTVEDGLKNMLSIPLSAQIAPVDEPTTIDFKVDELEALSAAIENRPELEQTKLDILNKEELKDFYQNQMLPRLAIQTTLALQGLGGDENDKRLVFGEDTPAPISGQFDSSGDAFSQLFQGDFPSWQIMAIFSFPLFNTTARGEYQKARAEFERSVIEQSKILDDINLEVKNAIREVQNSLRKVEAGRISVELAEEVLNNEEERLKVGIGTTRDVLEAQRDSLDARFREILATTQYNIGLADLERAKGTDMEKLGIVLDY